MKQYIYPLHQAFLDVLSIRFTNILGLEESGPRHEVDR